MTTTNDVAKNLRAIEDMAPRLEARAIDRATDRHIPGGDAMVALAGVSSLRDWNRRYEIHEEHGTAPDITHEDPEELWPALQVLWVWSEGFRQALSMDYEDPRWRPTLASEAAFLRNRDVAEWIWNNEPRYDAYASDVGRATANLRSILLESDHIERIRVVCDSETCETPKRLIRVYAPREHVADECTNCGELYGPDERDQCRCDGLLQPAYNSNPDDDRWKCPSCKHFFTTDDVRRAHAKQLRSEGAEKFVPLRDAVGTLRAQGRAERTIRKWLEDSKIETRHDAAGRVEAWWPDMWRLHLTTPSRRRAG